MQDSGVRIRRRKCLNRKCGHAWCTAQEPEYLLPRAKWKWTRRGDGSKPVLLTELLTEEALEQDTQDAPC